VPVEIALVTSIRRRILKCYSDISELDSLRRRKATAALERAKRLIVLGRKREALAILLEVVSQAHRNGLGWMFSDASGKAPLHVRAWEMMMACFEDGEKESEAAKAIAGLAVNEAKHLNEGIASLKSGQYAKAGVELYAAERAGLDYAAAVRKVAGKSARKPVTALIYLGYAHALAKDFAGAAKKFDDALRLDPENAEAWGGKGSLLEVLGKPAEAERCYGRVRAILEGERRKARDGGDAI